VQVDNRQVLVVQLVVAKDGDRAGCLGHGHVPEASLPGVSLLNPLQKSRPRRRLPARANGGREAPSDLTMEV
jgi:hypothetical protein